MQVVVVVAQPVMVRQQHLAVLVVEVPVALTTQMELQELATRVVVVAVVAAILLATA
jgi:hypothetical protein